MDFRENAGFYFEKFNTDKSKSLCNKGQQSVTLEEFGSKRIQCTGKNYKWVYYIPSKALPLDVFLHIDSPEVVILFYGSLYSKLDANTFADRLSAVNTSSSLASLLYDISGVYSGLVYMKFEDKTYAFVDQYGVKKAFYANREDGLVVTSHLMLLNDTHSGISPFSFGSIIYCGYVFCDSILKEVDQVNASCFTEIAKDHVKEYEYVSYPEPIDEVFENAVTRVQNAHLDFCARVKHVLNDDITLLLSRGKDARVILKHMLDSGIDLRIMSFFRDDSSLYPFVSTLLKSTEDYEAAAAVASNLSSEFSGLRIPNSYLLDNLDRIVDLNHGTPLHWEFLAAAEAVASKSTYAVTGFLGDLIAGKSHHYYLFKKIQTASEYSRVEFKKAGDRSTYSHINSLLKSVGFRELPTFEEMADRWEKQYAICCSDDLNHIFQQGLIRTRGLGRVGPTFDQMRLYAYPIYPYIDNRIIDAYRSLPKNHLRWEKAHIAQISEDPRFAEEPSTRLRVSVKQELKWLNAIGLLRKLDTIRKTIHARKARPSLSKDEALRKTLCEIGLDKSFWNKLEHLPRTLGFYKTISNLISAIRIESSIKESSSCSALEESLSPMEKYDRFK